MPTAQEAPGWERETAEIREWTEAEEHPLTQAEVGTENLSDVRIVARLDIEQTLQAEIERAKRIVKLEADWDGEGSLGYSQDTFDRAVAFLTAHMEGLWESCGIYSPVPTIGPGPDGSIDLHWKQPSWELLVNIPANANEAAVFYGDNYGAQKIRGSLDPRNFNLGIAAWLMS